MCYQQVKLTVEQLGSEKGNKKRRQFPCKGNNEESKIKNKLVAVAHCIGTAWVPDGSATECGLVAGKVPDRLLGIAEVPLSKPNSLRRCAAATHHSGISPHLMPACSSRKITVGKMDFPRGKIKYIISLLLTK